MSSATKTRRQAPTPGQVWKPKDGGFWSGFCIEARRREVREGEAEATDPQHTGCRGAFMQPPTKARPDGVFRCACPCHRGDEEPRDLEREIREARLAKALASGRSNVTVHAITGKRTKTHCRHGHEMTPENTGPGGVCRACKRDASARTKAKKAAEAAASGETA